jgi:hypothetical protein
MLTNHFNRQLIPAAGRPNDVSKCHDYWVEKQLKWRRPDIESNSVEEPCEHQERNY